MKRTSRFADRQAKRIASYGNDLSPIRKEGKMYWNGQQLSQDKSQIDKKTLEAYQVLNDQLVDRGNPVHDSINRLFPYKASLDPRMEQFHIYNDLSTASRETQEKLSKANGWVDPSSKQVVINTSESGTPHLDKTMRHELTHLFHVDQNNPDYLSGPKSMDLLLQNRINEDLSYYNWRDRKEIFENYQNGVNPTSKFSRNYKYDNIEDWVPDEAHAYMNEDLKKDRNFYLRKSQKDWEIVNPWIKNILSSELLQSFPATNDPLLKQDIKRVRNYYREKRADIPPKNRWYPNKEKPIRLNAGSMLTPAISDPLGARYGKAKPSPLPLFSPTLPVYKEKGLPPRQRAITTIIPREGRREEAKEYARGGRVPNRRAMFFDIMQELLNRK